jgi:hypothetical protein
VQVAVDTKHHLIVTHEVTNTGSDRSQLAKVAAQAKEVLGADDLAVVADRGYFNSTEILACAQADITVTLPKPMTSGAKSEGRFGKQDFVYLPTEDVYRCPAGQKLSYHYTNEEDGKALRRYWTTACPGCPIKTATFACLIRCRFTRWRQPPTSQLANRPMEIYSSHSIHRTSLKVPFERPWKLNSSRKAQLAIFATPHDGISGISVVAAEGHKWDTPKIGRERMDSSIQCRVARIRRSVYFRYCALAPFRPRCPCTYSPIISRAS